MGVGVKCSPTKAGFDSQCHTNVFLLQFLDILLRRRGFISLSIFLKEPVQLLKSTQILLSSPRLSSSVSKLC